MKTNAYRLVGRVLNERLSHPLRSAARYRFPILVQGESGSGKEVVAATIRSLSDRQEAPYGIYNCGQDHELISAELHGHVKGAFTGATESRVGIIQFAHGGTLLLDEIDKLRPSAQGTLLRVLSSSTTRALGATTETPVDVRVIATTNVDLARPVAEERFSHDLFARISGMIVRIPPLRERRADIPELIAHFLVERTRTDELPPVLPEETMAWLTSGHRWPGNVRELLHWVEACCASFPGESVSVDMARSLLPRIDDGMPTAEALEAAIRRHGGNRSKAARELGISRPTLYKILGL